ncbi:MAG: type II secretion system F family protein [Patescibacteria group bacterium]
MTKFDYTAVGADKKTVTGSIESTSLPSARSYLQKQGLRPLIVKAVKKGGGLKIPFLSSDKIKSRDMVIFTRQLATMINAGVPLVRSLATLQTQTESQAFKKHIAEIAKDIEGGTSFAEALDKHSSVFSPVYINMVRAGEAGGILDDILKKLAVQQEKDASIRKKFKSAMAYPSVLIFITFSVFIGLMTFVVPKIGKIIIDLGGENAEVPTLTRAMLAISGFMTSKWYILVAVTFLTVFFLRRFLKTPEGRRKRDKLLIRIPVLKTVVIKVAVARFARTFASLMSAGVSVIESINITSKAVGNSLVEDELLAAAKEVAEGQPFSVPLANSKIFPPIVSQMLAVGEETGQIGEILIKVADFYEEEVDATVESLSSILEPIMIVVMGAMVGLIAASVIGPISNLSSQI